MSTTEEKVTTYTVDPNDSRLTGIKDDAAKDDAAIVDMYDGQIAGVDTYTKDQIDAVKGWEDTQTKIQNENTEFAIDKINQDKENTRKDYIKEQSGAYVDWQKQSSKHGVNAEAMAARGMGVTGYSESSQVSMYNTYQNRVATAREAYSRAVQNYDNAITEARLANNSALAKIAYESLQKQLEISLAGFQYKNTLIQQKAAERRESKQTYMSLYNTMYGNIHNENVLNENARQHDESLAETKRHNEAQEGFSERSVAVSEGQLALEETKYQDSKEEEPTEPTEPPKIIKTSGTGAPKKVKGIGSGKSTILQDKKESPKSLGNKVGSKAPKVDTKSILNLGYGPISPNKLNTLIQQGRVKEYVKDGKLQYKKVFQYK